MLCEITIFQTIDIHDIDPNQQLRGLGYGDSALTERFLVHYRRILEETFPRILLSYEWRSVSSGGDHDDTVVYSKCKSSVMPCIHHEEVLYAVRTGDLYEKALNRLFRV